MEFNLFLVRHGETEHNKGCVIQGQLDIPLSENGITQAKLLARFIHNIQWKEVWTSDLKRSWQTANFLIDKNKTDDVDKDTLLVKPIPPIKTDARIRERHYGIAQGHSTANLQKLASKAGTKVNSFIPPEAESPEDVRKRAISFFKDLCTRQFSIKNEEDPSILLVGHGGWLREFMTYLASQVESSFSSDEIEAVGKLTPNTAVSRFAITLGNGGELVRIKCLAVHDKSHLINPCGFNEFAV